MCARGVKQVLHIAHSNACVMFLLSSRCLGVKIPPPSCQQCSASLHPAFFYNRETMTTSHPLQIADACSHRALSARPSSPPNYGDSFFPHLLPTCEFCRCCVLCSLHILVSRCRQYWCAKRKAASPKKDNFLWVNFHGGDARRGLRTTY